MRTTSWLLALFLSLSPWVCAAQETVREIEREGLERTAEGSAAQQDIDELHNETRALIDDYHARLKLVEGLRQYNRMLQKQLDDQRDDIATLQTSIADVAVVERQILPLLSRMIDGLEKFVALDVPFLQEERSARTAKLRELLVRSDVTVAEKARRVLEAYQIENDYGRTIEAYKAKLDLVDASFEIGRAHV